MDIDLKGRPVFVTGAAKGIGRAIAKVLAECGAPVAVADLDEAGARETAAAVTAAGGKARAFKLDVTAEKAVGAALDAAEKELGPLYALVNSAAILIPPRPFHTIDLKDWEAIFSVDVKGLFLCCKAIAPRMIERRRGVIVNIGSVAGKIQRLNMAAYCAAKAAVIHFSKVAAFELAPHGVRVIAQCPGTTATDMVMKTITGGDPEALAKWLAGIPMGRLAEPEDQARLTAFLISDLASHITGQAINVDGGQVLW